MPLIYNISKGSASGSLWTRHPTKLLRAFPPHHTLDVITHISYEQGNKLNCTKIKCVSKHSIKKVKRQPAELEKIFANHVSDECLVAKAYKKLLQLKSKNYKQPSAKMGQKLE